MFENFVRKYGQNVANFSKFHKIVLSETWKQYFSPPNRVEKGNGFYFFFLKKGKKEYIYGFFRKFEFWEFLTIFSSNPDLPFFWPGSEIMIFRPYLL